MKMPLLVVWSAQNSARIWKSLYAFFETRKPPLPLSATMAPFSARQLASPMGFQFSRPDVPSISVIQPASAWPEGCSAQPKKASPMTSSPVMANKRFIAISSPVVMRIALLPGAIVDGIFVGGARRDKLPVERPLIGMLEALTGVGLRRRVEDARELEVLELQQAAGLLDEIVRVALGVLLDRLCRLGFRLEHLLQGRAVEHVARGLAARGVRFHEHAQAALLGHADPRLHQADRRDLAAGQRVDT